MASKPFNIARWLGLMGVVMVIAACGGRVDDSHLPMPQRDLSGTEPVMNEDYRVQSRSAVP